MPRPAILIAAAVALAAIFAANAEDSTSTETSLYTKSIPMNWAGGELIEKCRMEQWIELRDEVATIRFRFTYNGDEEHPPRHQELPSVIIDHALSDLVYSI